MTLDTVFRLGEVVTIVVISSALIARFASMNQRIKELEHRMDRTVNFILSKK